MKRPLGWQATRRGPESQGMPLEAPSFGVSRPVPALKVNWSGSGPQIRHPGELVVRVDRQAERDLARSEGLGRVQGAIGLDCQHRYVAAAPVGDPRIFARAVQDGPGRLGPLLPPRPRGCNPPVFESRRTTPRPIPGTGPPPGPGPPVPASATGSSPRACRPRGVRSPNPRSSSKIWMSPGRAPTKCEGWDAAPCGPALAGGRRAGQTARQRRLATPSERACGQHIRAALRSSPQSNRSIEDWGAGFGSQPRRRGRLAWPTQRRS